MTYRDEEKEQRLKQLLKIPDAMQFPWIRPLAACGYQPGRYRGNGVRFGIVDTYVGFSDDPYISLGDWPYTLIQIDTDSFLPVAGTGQAYAFIHPLHESVQSVGQVSISFSQ